MNVDKWKLRSLRKLTVTAQLRQMAKENAIRKNRWRNHYGACDPVKDWPYALFLRSSIEDGILQVALYFPSYVLAGAKDPSYVVYVDRATQAFLTYGTERQNWLTGKLDRLDWPEYVGEYPAVYAARQDRERIQTYLGTQSDGYAGLLQYQKDLRDAEATARYRRTVAPWDADMALTPALPKDWLHWVDKVGIRENHLFYHYKRGGAREGYCTYCGRQVALTRQPYHNQMGHCPRCRKAVQYKAIGRIERFSTRTATVYLLQSRPDGLILREFEVSRTYDWKEWPSPKVNCLETRRSIYDRRFRVREYYWQNYKNRAIRWAPEEPAGYYGYFYYYSRYGAPGMVYGKTLPHLKRTELRHTELVEWIYTQKMLCQPAEYLKRLALVPPLEKIRKADLPRLFEECWEQTRTVQNCLKDPFASSLTKALGIDRQRLHRLRQKNGGWVLLSWLQYEKERNTQFPDDVLHWFAVHHITTQMVEFILGKMSPTQIRNYVQRQMNGGTDTVSQVITTWRDYLSMAESFGMNTDDEIIYRVSKLHLRHNQLVIRGKMANGAKQAAAVAAKHPNVEAVCKTLSKYAYEGERYAIVPPSNVEEIFTDGFVLNHCLFRSEVYWDRMESHETYILFLRRRAEPDIPYYTLEVEPNGTVRQARTEFDRQDEEFDAIKQFLQEWQTVLADRLTSTDRQRAEKSKTLRMQELEQMRTDNVRIRVGDLAGERLADVLMRDLMEVA